MSGGPYISHLNLIAAVGPYVPVISLAVIMDKNHRSYIDIHTNIKNDFIYIYVYMYIYIYISLLYIFFILFYAFLYLKHVSRCSVGACFEVFEHKNMF